MGNFLRCTRTSKLLAVEPDREMASDRRRLSSVGAEPLSPALHDKLLVDFMEQNQSLSQTYESTSGHISIQK